MLFFFLILQPNRTPMQKYQLNISRPAILFAAPTQASPLPWLSPNDRLNPSPSLTSSLTLTVGPVINPNPDPVYLSMGIHSPKCALASSHPSYYPYPSC